MAWIAPQISDLQAGISSVEINSIVAASANPSIVAEILQSTVDLIRGYCANVSALGPEGTIPDKLMDAAKDIWRFKFLTSVPGRLSGQMLDARRMTYKDAIDLLKSVQKGDFRIEAPLTPAPEQPAKPMPFVSNRRQARVTGLEAGLGGRLGGWGGGAAGGC